MMDTQQFDASISNVGYSKRKSKVNGANVCTIMADLPWDLGNSFKGWWMSIASIPYFMPCRLSVLPPGVRIDITLTHSPDDFKLLGTTRAGSHYAAVFQSVKLIVNRYSLQ